MSAAGTPATADRARASDYDAIELVLSRFGAPAIEWTSVVRDNLRDLRCSWVTWSKHAEAGQLARLGKGALLLSALQYPLC